MLSGNFKSYGFLYPKSICSRNKSLTTMSTFRVALAQINTVVGDIQGNLEKILHLIEQARSTKASLVAFPELAVHGYPPEDLLFKASFITENIQATQEIVSASNGIATVVGFADKSDSLYNAAALGYNGQTVSYTHLTLPTIYSV